jgi:hypothetical protein
MRRSRTEGQPFFVRRQVPVALMVGYGLRPSRQRPGHDWRGRPVVPHSSLRFQIGARLTSSVGRGAAWAVKSVPLKVGARGTLASFHSAMLPTPNLCEPTPNLFANRHDLSEQHRAVQGKNFPRRNLDESRTASLNRRVVTAASCKGGRKSGGKESSSTALQA